MSLRFARERLQSGSRAWRSAFRVRTHFQRLEQKRRFSADAAFWSLSVVTNTTGRRQAVFLTKAALMRRWSKKNWEQLTPMIFEKSSWCLVLQGERVGRFILWEHFLKTKNYFSPGKVVISSKWVEVRACAAVPVVCCLWFQHSARWLFTPTRLLCYLSGPCEILTEERQQMAVCVFFFFVCPKSSEAVWICSSPWESQQLVKALTRKRKGRMGTSSRNRVIFSGLKLV